MSLVYRAIRKYRQEGLKYVLIEGLDIGYKKTLYNAVSKYKIWMMKDVINYGGISLYIDSDLFTSELQERFARENYEWEEKQLIQNNLDRSQDIIELGAGVGFISCFLRTIQEKDYKLIAVEANPKLVEMININMALNRQSFDVINSAYCKGESTQLMSPDKFTVGSIYNPNGESINVECIQVSDIIEKYNLSTFSIVVDIEGSEGTLINQEIDLLEEYCHMICIEFHDHNDIYSETHDKIVSAKDKLENSSFECVDSCNNIRIYENKNL